jgi:hypothetical protein
MGAADGKVVGVKKIFDNGPDATRFNIVMLGDGFTAAEQGKYETAVDQFIGRLITTKPFDEYAVFGRLNVHRVDVHSNESGADNPLVCGDKTTPTGPTGAAETYFDAAFCNDGIRRKLLVNKQLALVTAATMVPEMKVAMVVVNHTEHGGTGGKVGCYSLHPEALDIALHELGHTAFGLADEYEYDVRCGDTEPGHEVYTGDEPAQPNATRNFDKATLKWRHLATPRHTPPSTYNLDCSRCPPQTSPHPPETVGAFVGAKSYRCGLYRPTFNCKMRQLDQPFCPVCRDVIRKTFAMVTPPSAPG